ncbi:hypothetical protein [Streptomyces sp. TE33382]
MIPRSPLPGLWPVLLVLTLAACGTEQAPGPDADGPGAAAPSVPVPGRAALEARAAAIQTTTGHVYVTEVPGYALARQSVGVLGDDGFGSFYVAAGGKRVQLSVERGTLTAANCAAGPLPGGGPGTPAACERDGENWYRSTPEGHEYARAEGEVVVRVGGARDEVDRDTLRAASEAAHRADDRELDEILPPAGQAPGAGPVERGDLPPVGDGAPNNEVGASG